MRKMLSILTVLFLAHGIQAHHGPGIRGYDHEKSIEISGVILKCQSCGSRGHGILHVKVDSVAWSVTLPSTYLLEKASVSTGKLKPRSVVKVTGLPNRTKANDLYAKEIITGGTTVLAKGAVNE